MIGVRSLSCAPRERLSIWSFFLSLSRTIDSFLDAGAMMMIRQVGVIDAEFFFFSSLSLSGTYTQAVTRVIDSIGTLYVSFFGSRRFSTALCLLCGKLFPRFQ